MILKRHALLISFMTFLFLGCSEENERPIENRTYAEEVFDSINSHRISQSLAPLVWDTTIERYAYDHSYTMATEKIPFGHEDFSARMDDLAKEIGGNGFAENVAWNYGSAEVVVDGWLGSQGHKDNIEGNYTHSAIGVAYSSTGEPYYTQIFVHK